MPDHRLLKKLLFGKVKRARPPDCPRFSFNDVVLCDCQNCHISVAYRDAQNKTALEGQDLPRMYLAHHEKARVTIMIMITIIIIIIIVVVVVTIMLHEAGTVMVKRLFEQQVVGQVKSNRWRGQRI